MGRMLRLLTAGESHGRGLAAVLEGLPADVPITADAIAHELARRRQGYGRGGRQKIEADGFEILAGVRHGRTLGSPVAVTIGNVEFEQKYRTLMSAEGEVDPGGPTDPSASRPRGPRGCAEVRLRRRAQRPGAGERPGDRRPRRRRRVLQGVPGGLGIEVLSHVVRIGKVRAPVRIPTPADRLAVDRSPVRCADDEASRAMVAEIDRVRKAKDTLGGVFEVLAYGLPPGIGSYVHWDRKLDARLAAALMSIQSVKGVEVGDGFASAARVGSKAHDEIVLRGGRLARSSARAGGIEGGMSTGQPIRVRAAMKPFSTVPKPLRTVDLRTREPAVAIKQRTDVCAVPAGGVVGEAVVAFVLADAVLEKFGGDSLPETRGNLDRYLEGLG